MAMVLQCTKVMCKTGHVVDLKANAICCCVAEGIYCSCYLFVLRVYCSLYIRENVRYLFERQKFDVLVAVASTLNNIAL